MKFLTKLPLNRKSKNYEQSTQAFPARKVGYVALMRRQRRSYRLLFALSLGLVYLIFVWLDVAAVQPWVNIIFIAFMLLFPEYIFTPHSQSDPIRNMPGMLHREMRGETPVLRVGMEEASLEIVKKVAISQRDQTYGFIDFPYTSRINSPLLFPVNQINSVRQWFAEHAPELELIE